MMRMKLMKFVVATLASLVLVNAQAATVPAKGAADTLDIGSWNIEWFGDTANGPSNETLQLQNARDVIAGSDLDIWGVAEIVSTAQFNSLKSQLPGYTGFLANDPRVVDGAAYFNTTEQKVGLLYKSGLATVTDARIILTANNDDFAGRPPMQVKLLANLNGRSEEIVVIVLHAKCCSDNDSWTRRVSAANALKSYLDANLPTQKVWVIGDFNDDLDTSITPGQVSPYANFVNDVADYRFPTKALSDAHIASTVEFPDTIDHHLTSNDAYAAYLANSAQVYRVDQYISSYGTTTSDHYPVLSRYSWAGTPGMPNVRVNAPNGGESWVAGSTQNITWTTTNVFNVRIEYSLDNGAAWTTLSASTPASVGTYAWTLPNVSSTQVRVRVSDIATATSDVSDSAFSITQTGGGPAKVVLNEICANEPGSDTAGEFVEIVNVGGTAANIGGWTVSDASSVRHTFPAGTTLAAGKAIVIFGGASAIPGGLSNAVAATSGGLSLNNTSDTVALKGTGGGVIDSFTYPSSLANTDGVSMNRNPDGSATGTFVKHDALSMLARSAGLRASGAAW